jgi:hypothetical protein
MTTSIQRVIKKTKEVILKVPKKISLHIALMVTTNDRKNYASMARSNGISYAKVCIRKDQVKERIDDSARFLISLIKRLSTKKNPGYLVADFTILNKPFSENIPSVTYDYDGVGKLVSKGFSAGFIFWSNGPITIPFDYTLWHREKDVGELYKKKTELVKEIIKLARENEIPFDEIKLDGAFASQDMLEFFVRENIHFTLRIPSNRVITTKDGNYQLSKHPGLKLQRNQKYKTIFASYKGTYCYFTVHKRNGTKNTKEVVFIVSDIYRSAKKHVDSYAKRWVAEKFFRTGKQYIGLTDCQSTNADKQRLHLFSVMISYAVLQLMRIDKKKQSVEEVLHCVRRQKMVDDLFGYIDLERTFMC